MGLEKVREAHWRLTREALNGVVSSSKDPVLMVFRDLFEVLPQGVVRAFLIAAFSGDTPGSILEIPSRNLPVREWLPDGFADLFRDLGEAVFLRPVEGIDLTDMFRRGEKNLCDNASLVFRCDRCVLACSKGECQRTRLDLSYPVESPFCEESGAQMGYRDAAPIENLLGDPMVLRGMALCFSPAEICDILTTDLSCASFAAWAK